MRDARFTRQSLSHVIKSLITIISFCQAGYSRLSKYADFIKWRNIATTTWARAWNIQSVLIMVYSSSSSNWSISNNQICMLDCWLLLFIIGRLIKIDTNFFVDAWSVICPFVPSKFFKPGPIVHTGFNAPPWIKRKK